jgi:hypothetical protein
MSPKAIASIHSDRRIRPPFVLLIVSETDALYTWAGAKDGASHAGNKDRLTFSDGWRNIAIALNDQRSKRSIKRDVKKKILPRPEGEKILSRDPAHITVRVPLDLRERFCF